MASSSPIARARTTSNARLVISGGAVNNVHSFVGMEDNGTGTVTVIGAGSSLNVTDTLYLGSDGFGDAGTGHLEVTDGATANLSGWQFGDVTGGRGSVTVSNRGTLDTTGFVGPTLAETLTPGETAQVIVTGPGATWNASEPVVISLTQGAMVCTGRPDHVLLQKGLTGHG